MRSLFFNFFLWGVRFNQTPLFYQSNMTQHRPRKYPYTREANNHYLRMLPVTDEELDEVKKIMEKLDYCTECDIPIWKQFHMRHNLPYK